MSNETPPNNNKSTGDNKAKAKAPKGRVAGTSTSNEFDDDQIESLASDTSPGDGAAVLRESARLHLDIKNYKRQNMRLLLGNTAQAATLVVVFTAMVAWYPKYRYIPTTNNTAVCEVSPESDPRVTPATLTEYAKDAVVNVNSYDYVNYRSRLEAATAKYFTGEGRRQYMASLDSSGNLDKVIKGRLILRSMAINTPQLEEQGRKPTGQRFWIVHVPTSIEFYSGGEQQPRSRQDFIAIVTVIQTPASATNLKGIAVESIQLAPYFGRR